MAETLGEAVIRITADASSYRRTVTAIKKTKDIQKTVKIDLDSGDFESKVDGLNKKLKTSGLTKPVKLSVDTKSAQKGLLGLEKQSSSFVDKYVKGMVSARLATVALGAAAVPAAASVAQISGAALLLPSAIGAAAVAVGTLKVGLSGISDAFANVDDPKKFAEALEKLAPAAQQFVLQAASMKSAWEGVTKSVQENLFEGFADDLRLLGTTLLPVLQAGLEKSATSLNDVAGGFVEVLSGSKALNGISTIFDNTAAGISNASTGLARFAQGFVTLAAAGSAYFQSAGTAFTSFGVQFDEWATRITSDGTFTTWVDNAISRIGLLGSIFKNLGEATANIFGAIAADGTSILETIDGLTAKFADWTATASAQTGISETFKSIGSSIGDVFTILGNLAPAFLEAFSAAKSVVEPLVPILIGVSEWIGNNAEVVGVLVAAFVGAQIVIGIINGISAAMGVLNAVMAANPIAIIAVAIGALVAGFLYLWNNVEGFRNFWIEVWASIVAVWNGFVAALQTGWAFLQPMFTAMGEAFLWLWSYAIKPVVDAIVAGWGLMVAALKGAWDTILYPMIQLIGSTFSLLWSAIVAPIWEAMKVAWNVLIYAMQFAWASFLKPMLDAFGATFSLLWTGVLSPIWAAMQAGWSGLMSGMSAVWNGVLRPVFDAMANAVNWLIGVFQSGINAIGKAWDTLKQLVTTPIKWIVDTVWNNGIRKAWNWISDWWGADPVPPFNLGFASGGVFAPGASNSRASGGTLPGYTPGRDVHKFYSATGGILNLSGGEAIMRPEFTRAIGGASGVDALNRAARHGDLEKMLARVGMGDPPNPRAAKGAIKQSSYTGSFANGGVFGGSQSFASGGVVQSFDKGGVWEVPGWLSWLVPDWLEGFISDVVNHPMFDIIGGLASQAMKGIWGGIKSAWDAFWGDDVDTAGISGSLKGSAAKYKGALSFAQQQKGKPYVWAAVGPGGYDCSGFMSAITNVLRGRPPHSRVGATASFPWAGFKSGAKGAFTIGSSKNTGSGIGHMAGTLMGVNVESAGGAGVLVGKGARGYNSGIFNTYAGLFDNGGYLPTGFSVVENRTGRPEAVLTPTQTDNLKSLAEGSGGDSYGDINVTLSIDDVARIRDLDAFLDMIKGQRNRSRQTRNSGFVAG